MKTFSHLIMTQDRYHPTLIYGTLLSDWVFKELKQSHETRYNVYLMWKFLQICIARYKLFMFFFLILPTMYIMYSLLLTETAFEIIRKEEVLKKQVSCRCFTSTTKDERRKNIMRTSDRKCEAWRRAHTNTL